MPDLTTLGDVQRNGYRFCVQCRACNRKTFILPGTLIERFGPATVALSLNPRFVCQRCGHRGCNVSLVAFPDG